MQFKRLLLAMMFISSTAQASFKVVPDQDFDERLSLMAGKEEGDLTLIYSDSKNPLKQIYDKGLHECMTEPDRIAACLPRRQRLLFCSNLVKASYVRDNAQDSERTARGQHKEAAKLKVEILKGLISSMLDEACKK